MHFLEKPQYVSDKFYEKQMDVLRERLGTADTQEEKDAIEALRKNAIDARKVTVADRTEFRKQYTENVFKKRNKQLVDPF